MSNIIKINSLEFEQSNFLKEVPEDFKNEIYACIHLNGEVILYTHNQLSQSQIEQLEQIMINHNKVTKADLRVHRVLSKDLDPATSDFTILGFKKMSPSYVRGKKTRAIYKCIDKDEIIVEKIFTDIRDENNILTGLEVTFNWYDENNLIGLTKTEVVKTYNKFEAETEERKRRYRQFDYLRASAKGTPNEPYIAMIINFFSTDINKYQDDGLLNLETRMNEVLQKDLSQIQSNEERNLIGTLQQILNASVPRNDNVGDTTVLRSIQYQIGTIKIEEL